MIKSEKFSKRNQQARLFLLHLFSVYNYKGYLLLGVGENKFGVFISFNKLGGGRSWYGNLVKIVLNNFEVLN